jgi:DMSO/TMAO reductase YedYZ heme-binding membrane subunit
MMKIYFKAIQYLQQALLGEGILIMLILPLVIIFREDLISVSVAQQLYAVSHWVLFFVMIIRPLADIFTKAKWIRPLVILRKGAGVMSASIIVSFILPKLMIDPVGYVASIGTLEYWSLYKFAVLAHVADISAVLLIVTSNNLSKKLLGSWWKKIQRLSYVYFYGSGLYVGLMYGNKEMIVAMVLVVAVSLWASVKNNNKLKEITT